MSIVVPPNAVVTLDLALVERMVEFTIQPHNCRERSGKQLTATITDMFSQLLVVSFLFLSPFFIACVILTDISVAASGHRHPSDLGLLHGIGLVGCQPPKMLGGHEGGGPGIGRVSAGLGGGDQSPLD